MSKQRNIRKKRALQEEEPEVVENGEDEVSLRDKLEATRNLQKQRQRSQGLAAEELAGAPMQAGGSGLLPGAVDEAVMGGYIKEQVKLVKDDADPELEKYVQQQLDKRLGRAKPEDDAAQPSKVDDMYAIPTALRAQNANKEDVSAWMTGIVEVPLSVSHKLKNIEETEAVKKQLLEKTRTAQYDRDDEDEQVEVKEDRLRRITYPLKFGKQSEKEQAWREKKLQKPLVTAGDRKTKKRMA